MNPFSRSEKALIDDIHKLEDRLDWLVSQGDEPDGSFVQPLKAKIADGKAALFLLQQVIGKYRHPERGFVVVRDNAS